MGVLSLSRRMLGYSLELRETSKTFFILAGDSSAAIAMSREKGMHKRNRHIDVRATWLQHFMRTAGVRLQKVAGKEYLSDVLTKVDSWPESHMYYLGVSKIRKVPGVENCWTESNHLGKQTRYVACIVLETNRRIETEAGRKGDDPGKGTETRKGYALGKGRAASRGRGAVSDKVRVVFSIGPP